MATPNSSTKSSAPAAPIDPAPAATISDLDLAGLGPFRSQPLRVADPDAFITFMTRLLLDAGARPEIMEQRAADRCPAEFDLEHPERVEACHPVDQINQLFALCEQQRADWLLSPPD